MKRIGKTKLCPSLTYIISGEVEYELEDKVYYKQINIEVSIFLRLEVCLLEH